MPNTIALMSIKNTPLSDSLDLKNRIPSTIDLSPAPLVPDGGGSGAIREHRHDRTYERGDVYPIGRREAELGNGDSCDRRSDGSGRLDHQHLQRKAEGRFAADTIRGRAAARAGELMPDMKAFAAVST